MFSFQEHYDVFVRVALIFIIIIIIITSNRSIHTASYIAGQPSVTVLLGYIDRCTALNTITLVTFHYAVIMINTLMSSK